MNDTSSIENARPAGLALLGSIIIGILAAVTVAPGIDVNLTGDIGATAANMRDAGDKLLALAWMRATVFALELLFYVGLWLCTRHRAPLLAGWSAALGVASAVIGALGIVAVMNAEVLAAQSGMADGALLALLSEQATLDYTSFHAALVLGSVAKAGFFAVMLVGRMMPRWLSGFGLFASLFVAVAVIGRDFVPALGAGAITSAFLACNLLALIGLGVYLASKGRLA